ncbi:hypothetical protein SETIT_5G447500v2 [Setaria italica]|uniref:Uncharacterized protein n=1 Tax=Setaria italica TaxID=4555 RepID=A0A368RHF3_SETIT|nr:hypothetical protein SETIT_5G447500v2 [Setaria italica]
MHAETRRRLTWDHGGGYSGGHRRQRDLAGCHVAGLNIFAARMVLAFVRRAKSAYSARWKSEVRNFVPGNACQGRTQS